MINQYYSYQEPNTSNKQSYLTISIFQVLAVFIATISPIFAIPFAVLSVTSSFETKSLFHKVGSIIVSCFVAIMIIVLFEQIISTGIDPQA